MSDKIRQFAELVAEIKSHHCSLRDGCQQAVPGDGNIDSPVVFIGEAPGKMEDEVGRPFVGRAGGLLSEALATIGWQREDIYITNVVKCRPPDNRDPLPEEVEEHKKFLARELALINPKLIVLLGRHALHWFLPAEKISDIRGTAKRRGNQIFFPIYHPAAALYDPRLKDTLMSDFKNIPVLLEKIGQLSETKSPVSSIQSSIF